MSIGVFRCGDAALQLVLASFNKKLHTLSKAHHLGICFVLKRKGCFINQDSGSCRSKQKKDGKVLLFRKGPSAETISSVTSKLGQLSLF